MTASMDSLPDEMLVMVFSFLCPRDLLGPVPVVCKRWCEIARSKAVWRNIGVEWKNRLSKRAKNTVTRALRLAPALSSVTLKGMDAKKRAKSIHLHQDREPLSLVLGGVSEVGHLNLKYCRFEEEDGIIQLLTKFKDTLVSLEINFGHLQRPKVNRAGVLEILASMPRLESLHIRLRFTTHGSVNAEYSGQLGRGCPALKRFSYDWISYHDDADADVVMWDVMRTHGPHLTHLSLLPGWRYFYKSFENNSALAKLETVNNQLAEALTSCPNLLSVSVPDFYVDLIRDMHHLHSLHIYFDLLMSEIEQMRIADFIRSSSVMANLRELQLTQYDQASRKPAMPLILAAIAATCHELRILRLQRGSTREFCTMLQALRPALSKLIYLSFYLIPSPPDEEPLIDIIASLPSLRFVRFEIRKINPPTASHLQKLSARQSYKESIVAAMKAPQPKLVVTIDDKYFW